MRTADLASLLEAAAPCGTPMGHVGFRISDLASFLEAAAPCWHSDGHVGFRIAESLRRVATTPRLRSLAKPNPKSEMPYSIRNPQSERPLTSAFRIPQSAFPDHAPFHH